MLGLVGSVFGRIELDVHSFFVVTNTLSCKVFVATRKLSRVAYGRRDGTKVGNLRNDGPELLEP
jgi:hypothetical protein